MDLCQFFTADDCCDALISEIGAEFPRSVVDLGAGHGGLAGAALRRWSGIDLRLLDIDRAAMARLKSVFPAAEQVRANLLLPRMPEALEHWVDHADIALCNPPFRYVPPKTADYWLRRAGMPTNWSVHIRQRAEMVFLAHNLRLLKTNGELAIILPACFVNGHHFLPFRQWLLQRMTVTKVARLPQHAFREADVNAFAIIARNQVPRSPYSVELIDLAGAGPAYRSISISSTVGATRLDIASHELPRQRAVMRLKDVSPQIVRGRAVAELRNWGQPFFHTTHFEPASGPGNLCLPRNALVNPKWHTAETGDLLLGRVGRSCHTQAARVIRGTSHFSDCVYRIRVATQFRKVALQSLLGADGMTWRASKLRGSTVSVLSKADLLEHPIWDDI